MSVAPARRAALKALARVRRAEAFSGPVLAAELRRAALGPDDAALATRLTYGTLAAEGVLDEAIDRHLRGSAEPAVRDVLRMAAFELLFGRAPAYAIVDQAVDAARRVRPQAAGLANAVTRRLAESAETFPWGDPATDRDALARATGHPRWIADLALRDLGDRAGRQMLDCGMEPSPTYARVNPFAADPAETLARLAPAEPELSPPDSDCYRLHRPAAAFGVAQSGWFPMDAAAQMAPALCEPTADQAVLDVGSGRGNKTVCLQAIARRTGGLARIVAADIHPSKATALGARLHDEGVPGVEVRVADALELAQTFGDERFDAVLLDAPCTGLGTLRRYPEKRWRLRPQDVERMAALQVTLVEACCVMVGPGGRMVYSTCSVAREENEGVIDAFLGGSHGRSFELEPAENLVPEEWADFRSARGCFQSWPTSGGPDGHFAAILRRRDG